jgi:hypothetical protein
MLNNKKPRVTSEREVTIGINGNGSAVCQKPKLEMPISPRRRAASWLNQLNTKLA